ncbi:hypothetical protein APHNP_1493 [Anaplasma phagocytophilum str. ApNP]|uniref:Uncharacterized protein n=1 Tax=Anaplasma phagocytophilum str. ApNP TaxID=1359153 RepID=A0A0F3NF46_ANAPH|nr:hypothetical protein APHNP_1493 [Anaplasma phagocytophilum str. ApNP]
MFIYISAHRCRLDQKFLWACTITAFAKNYDFDNESMT